MPSRIRQYANDSVERVKKPIVVQHPVTRVYRTTRQHTIIVPDDTQENQEPAPQVKHKRTALINRVRQTTAQMAQRIQKKQYY
jgi:hypothetical protein